MRNRLPEHREDLMVPINHGRDAGQEPETPRPGHRLPIAEVLGVLTVVNLPECTEDLRASVPVQRQHRGEVLQQQERQPLGIQPFEEAGVLPLEPGHERLAGKRGQLVDLGAVAQRLQDLGLPRGRRGDKLQPQRVTTGAVSDHGRRRHVHGDQVGQVQIPLEGLVEAGQIRHAH
jgi:hypothetical protein